MTAFPLPEFALFLSILLSLHCVMALRHVYTIGKTYASATLTALAWAWFYYLTH